MIPSTLLVLVSLVSVTQAAAAPKILSADDVIVLKTDGTSQVMKAADLEQFLNWDVPMSPVISSLDGSKATVSVTSGFTIANSLKVGASFSIPLIEDILTTSLSIDYTETWTSSQQQSLSFQVPENHHGLIVSQPYVRRVQGNVLDGCGDEIEKTEFTSDSYESQTYGNLEWVKGIIRLCSSETYPVPFCNGEGEHK
ncbi:hypothetical protein FOC1_g10000825 [Fusarium oxysporum f. sp. cubense race 1]|uniref:Uncharacterized protein n=1 Tax=Fusarium oxysporum f. sp. cubense (strain race 1) TaxID=1229664 RepID=N4U5I0_FUSC1|nr:hypothetical protein FOC1_g10000825 [Fusarium oxysporum f. sp. cubense race 1]